MHEGWMNQIKSCVWHNLLKADFIPHTITVVLWDSWTFVFQDKMIYSTKMKHTRSCTRALQTTQCLFLSLWHKMNAQKYSHFEIFFFPWKVLFYKWGTMNYYTLLNRHSVSVITVVHRLTDSKIKIIKYYYLDK